MNGATHNPDGRKLAGLALIPVFLIIIGVLAALNIPGSLEYPFALALLNTLFLGIIPIVIAYLTFRVVSRSGSASVFLLGSGVLIFGLGSIAAGWISPLPGGPNMTVTIHNTCACIGSVLIFAGAVIRRPGTKTGAGNISAGMVAAAYAGIFVFVTALSLAALQGMTPPFFVPGSGPTVLRQVILENAVLLFAISSGLFMAGWRRERSDFFFWYAGAFALIAVGLLAVFIQPSVGSLIGWAGRIAQYLGSVYALNAILIARQTAAKKGLPLEEVIAGFFMDAEQSYTSLVETATDAIVVFDADERVIVWNPAAETLFGYRKEEAMGSSFMDLAIPDESAGIIKYNFRAPATTGTDPASHRSIEIIARRKDGRMFPAELALSRHMVAGTWVSTCIVHDLTESKKTETELKQKNEDLLALNEKLTATQEELRRTIDDLTGTEKTLRESEDRFRTIAETLPVLISLSSTEDSRILFTNTVYNKAFGFSSEEIIGRKGQEVYYDPAERTKMIAAIREQGFVSNYRLKAKKADGTPLWLLSSVRPILYDGKPAIIGASIDIMDLVRAEETLKEAHLRTNAILEGIADTFYSLDEQWRFVMVNPAAEKAPFGRPAAEMLGKVIWELYPGLVGTRIHRHYLDAAEKQSLEHYEALSPLNSRWYEVFMKGVKGGVDVYMRDITGRKQAEEERTRLLAEVEDRAAALEATISSMAIGLIVYDPSGKATRMNTAAKKVFPPELFFNRTVEERSHVIHWERENGEPFPADEIPVARALRGETTYNVVIAAPFPDHTLWISASAAPVITPGGRMLGAVASFVDITESRRLEEALRVSRREKTFLAELLNSSEQPFAVGYPDGRIGILNGAFERLTGYSADELRTMDWATVLTPPEWQEPEKKSLEELHRTGKPVRYEKEYIRKDGSRVPIELLVHLVKDSGGKPRHYYSFITDITERRRAKEELEKKNEDLNALNEELTSTEEELHQNIEELSRRERDLTRVLAEKEVLLSEIHHRVKNNLTAFISLLSLEGSTEETPSGKLLKQDLQNRARSMALVHETLYRTNLFDEVDMGIYLTTLIDQVANSFRTKRPVKTMVEAHGVMLDIPRATPAGLIINELVTNSFKYAFPESFDARTVRHASPAISITLTKIDGEYVMAVKDNGVGLPLGFDLAKTRTLGLKLVNFLSRHQMRAKVEVHSDKGTEFIFRFKE